MFVMLEYTAAGFYPYWGVFNQPGCGRSGVGFSLAENELNWVCFPLQCLLQLLKPHISTCVLKYFHISTQFSQGEPKKFLKKNVIKSLLSTTS